MTSLASLEHGTVPVLIDDGHICTTMQEKGDHLWAGGGGGGSSQFTSASAVCTSKHANTKPPDLTAPTGTTAPATHLPT